MESPRYADSLYTPASTSKRMTIDHQKESVVVSTSSLDQTPRHSSEIIRVVNLNKSVKMQDGDYKDSNNRAEDSTAISNIGMHREDKHETFQKLLHYYENQEEPQLYNYPGNTKSVDSSSSLDSFGYSIEKRALAPVATRGSRNDARRNGEIPASMTGVPRPVEHEPGSECVRRQHQQHQHDSYNMLLL